MIAEVVPAGTVQVPDEEKVWAWALGNIRKDMLENIINTIAPRFISRPFKVFWGWALDINRINVKEALRIT
jgi:hypothetical protein